MNEIRYTLLSEGTSDKALLPILNWLLRKYFPGYAIQSEWADLARLPRAPRTLSERIRRSAELYPCDILFVHRDADSQGFGQRIDEISGAFRAVEEHLNQVFLICVIPVRMMEAWLLFDENIIRTAADNPRGRERLSMPSIRTVEQHSDPKSLLHDLLRQASGLSGRKLKKFNARLSEKVHRIASISEDFSPLRNLEAFQLLESNLIRLSEQDFIGRAGE